MAAVRLDSLTKCYRSKHREVCAVNDLTLDIVDGEFLVLVGPSGCGKTTTLRLLAGLDEPTRGTVSIGGADMTRVAPKDRDVAMVFQSYALYPHMTAYKNMAFGLKMRRVPKAEIDRQVRETAELLGIAHLLEHRPDQLSGGEQQRVAVGRAIVRKPNVFLLDEPFANLDARLRLQTRTEIKRLHRVLGTTLIHVTHDQEEAMTLGDRIAVMHDGQLQQCGTPMEVYERPTNRFVASFVGTPPMNFLSGTIEGIGVNRVFVGPLGRLPLTAWNHGAEWPEPGQAIHLGIRPQHLRIRSMRNDQATAAHNSIDRVRRSEDRFLELTGALAVELIDRLGDVTHVHLRSNGDDKLVVRTVESIALEPGDVVHACVEREKVHWFAAEAKGVRIG